MKQKTKNELRENICHDFEIQAEINRVNKKKPYVDPVSGVLYWGSDEGRRKERKK